MDEAHVQHVVGLVQHQIGAFFKADVAAFQQVDQATRGGDKNVGALGERLRLFEQGRTADDHRDLHGGAFGKDLEVVFDLGDQFAGRRKDQRAHVLWPRRMAEVEKPVQKRQPEGRGLAGSGLGEAHQVPALHDMGNGLRLDRRGRLESGLFQRFQDRGGQAEFGKGGHMVLPTAKGTRPSPRTNARDRAAMRRPCVTVGTLVSGPFGAHAARASDRAEMGGEATEVKRVLSDGEGGGLNAVALSGKTGPPRVSRVLSPDRCGPGRQRIAARRVRCRRRRLGHDRRSLAGPWRRGTDRMG